MKSKETRKKISEYVKNSWKNNPNQGMKGKKHSKESNEKNRLSHLGKKFSKEEYPNHGMRNKNHTNEFKKQRTLDYENNVNFKNKAKNPSEETKKKISVSVKKLMKNPEHREKIREATKKALNTYDVKEKLRTSHIGKHNSEESKEKQRMNAKINPNYGTRGKTFPKELYPEWGWRKTRKNQIFPIKDTKIEVKIQNFLDIQQIEYFTHKYMNIEHGYQCDIFVPSINLVIECDGNYWHKYPIGKGIDKIRTFELMEKGFNVLRLWECEIKNMSLEEFKLKLNTLTIK